MKSLIKALEGWLGLGGGALGVATVFAMSLAGPRAYNLASAYAKAVPYDSPGIFTPQVFLALSALPFIAATIFFAGAGTGAWLDLTGQRRIGKLVLVTCLVGLLGAMWTATSISTTLTVSIWICFLPILGATIIASIRKEPSSTV